MAVGYSSPEDVCNAALRLVGYPRPISEIYDGSKAARVALEIYGATRDALLRSKDWDFAYREATLAAVNGGHTIAGFGQEYTYPADCLRLLQVRGAIPSPNNDPQPVRWKTYNDNTLNPAVKAVAANIAPATACYIGQILDPLTWEPLFTRAFVGKLAEIFSVALGNDPNLAKMRSELAEMQTEEAGSASDQEPMPAMPPLAMARQMAQRAG